MTDIMNNWYPHPQNKIIFFISKLFQHHSSTWTNNWYSELYKLIVWHPSNIQALFKQYSSINQASFKFTLLLNSIDYSSILCGPDPLTSTIPAVYKTKFFLRKANSRGRGGEYIWREVPGAIKSWTTIIQQRGQLTEDMWREMSWCQKKRNHCNKRRTKD